MKKGIYLISFFLLSFSLCSQNNCLQFPVTPINIINNPSFEIDPASCNSGYFNEQGLIIPFWTTPTNEVLTGYLNACTNFLVPANIITSEAYNNVYMYEFPVVPQPIPDGNGVAVIADFGSDGAIHTYPFRKSYVSTCLTDGLQKDSLYELDFYVGFGTKGKEILIVNNSVLIPEESLPTEKFTLFGYADCSNNGIPIVGCPAVSGWTSLGSVVVQSDLGKWVKTNIKFKAPGNFQGIALGSSCDTNLVLQPDLYNYNGQEIAENKYSFFLDAVQFNKSTVPAPTIQIVGGSSCSNAISLQLQPAVFYSGYTLQWYKNGALLNNENNSTLTVERKNYGTGFYQCSVQNSNTCLASDSLYVQLTPMPNTSFLGLPDTLACVGDTVLLNPFSDTSFNYVWQDGSTNASFSATQNGAYSVTVSNACGTVQAQKMVTFQKCYLDIFVPNAFTPNGDGKNDFFQLTYMTPPIKFKMNIYNRNGQRIFSSSDPSAAWDGNFKGKTQPTGTYVYELEFTDRKNASHILKGVIELIR